MRRIGKLWTHFTAQMVGDCKRRGCGHSIIYHFLFAGCMKCSCDEFR